MSEPFKLYRLQQIDTHLDQTRARLREIEAALHDQTELVAASKNADDAAASLAAALRVLRRAEDDVQSQRIKIEQTEASLYGGKVHNPKELQDLQNESAALKRYLVVLEDRQLDAMFSAEDTEQQHNSALKSLQELRERFSANTQKLTQEQATLMQEVARQEKERSAVASGLMESEQNLYEQLRKQRRGLAVARVADRNCAACGSTLSSALLHSARSLNQIVRCETCGRILYAG